MKWSRRTVTGPAADLAVFEGGDRRRRTIVMVHGWPDTHHLWNGVADRLVDRFHVVAYDTRGMGESGDPGTVSGFALDQLADDLFAVVDEVGGGRPVHVLAHDWGSVQAWEAVCRPGAEQRIASFVSMSGPNIDHLRGWVDAAVGERDLRRVGAVARQGLASSYIAVFVTPVGRWLFERFATRERWERFLQRTEGIEPAAEHHADTLPQDMVSGLRYYRANVSTGLARPRERRTAVPVLQLVATRDRAITRAAIDASRPWVDRLEQVELPYGHWVQLRRPDLVAEEVTKFVDSLGSRSAP